MKFRNRKARFAAIALMAACVIYTAGFTSYAMSPDSEAVLADGAVREARESARGRKEAEVDEEKIQRAARQAKDAARQAKEAAQEAKEAEEEARKALQEHQRLLAALIFCEAGNQPYEGQVAVGAVVMNRVASGKYPGSVREVIYQSGQFGPAMTGWLDTVLANGSYTESAMRAAADALAGADPVEGCLYFGNGNYGIRIGDHYFH